MNEAIISALMKKRKEILAALTKYEREVTEHRSALRTCDAAIRLYKPEHDLPIVGPNRRAKGPNRFFKSGEVSMLIQDFMRDWEGEESPHSNDVIYSLAELKGIQYDKLDESTRISFYKAVARGLSYGAKRGWLMLDFKRDGLNYWRLPNIDDVVE